MKKALITGVTGQDGVYLAKLLLEKDYKVYGIVRRITNRDFINLEYLGVANEVNYYDADLSDETYLLNAVKKIFSDETYNLGAQSFAGISWEQPIVTCEVNAMGTLKLLNAVKFICPETNFFQASTSETFGNSNQDGIQNENTSFHPRSPYGISKLFSHWIAVNFRKSYNMFCACGTMFNHESPIRGIEFVTRKLQME